MIGTEPLLPELRTQKVKQRLGRPLSKRGRRKAWVTAAGTIESRLTAAAFYLNGFDHRGAAIFDQPVKTMAKVVCNLRNYYLLDAKQTAELMISLFNPRAPFRWSEESILLTWEQVEGFTPSLGLSDKDAVAKHLLADLEEDVIDLLAHTLPGRRVSVSDLFSRFQELYPEVETNEIAFGRVVTSLTGISSKSSKGVRYYSGFHLPKATKDVAASQVVPIKKLKVKATDASSQPSTAA